MQKKLIALAIAGLSGAAFAQTNVTIYGVADATFDFINVKDGNTGANNPNFNRVSTNGSRLGLRGTENLGNGLNAIFQFESDANFDSGGGLNTSRDSFVGLSGDFGKVLLGTLTGPTRALGEALDVNATADGIMSNKAVLGKLGGALTQGNGASMADTRWNNAIAYVSPSFSGLQATAAYTTAENKDENTFSKINTNGYDLGLNYNNGPVMVGATYNQVNERNGGFTPSIVGTGNDEKIKVWRVGGMYDFGNATVRALYDRTKANGSLGEVKQSVWGIGGTFNVTPNGKITAQYYQAKDLNLTGGNDNDTGAKFYTIGYEHSLSKRTMLKAGYAYLKNDSQVATNGNGGYDFGNNPASANSGVTIGDGVKLSGFQFGLRHSF